MRTKSDKHIKPKLKPQHQIFVAEIAKGETQRAAYLTAYPNVSSLEVADVNASRLLRNAKVSEAVQRRISRALNNSQVTVEEVVGSSVRQMRSSIDDVLDDEGSFSIEKARETGAIDFVKGHSETTVYRKNGDIVKTVNVDLLSNESGRREVAGYMELAKNKANLEKPALVAKFINNCFDTIERKVADNPDELPQFTKSDVIRIFCTKFDVAPELVAPLVREILLLED